ncbi:adenylosuccinate lyase [Candidatus Sumerlaeota bacterium]|nr:adenylosuccinate lyase [Candidatus Sumerlaeota bacterium]
MIDRYTLSEMRDLWSEEAKFQSWLDVEILACEAWAKKGEIPAADLRNIKKKAKFTVAEIEKIEQTVHHDVIAFTTCLANHIGKSARFVHLGLTSSDVVDTALALRMAKGFDLIFDKLDVLLKTLEKKAKAYKRMTMMGRTHGIHAEPTTLGLKFLIWLMEMRRNRTRLEAARKTIAVGKISGAVGTYAHTGPFIERYVCKKLGLAPAPVSTQVLQRDRHAEVLSAIALTGATVEKIATEVRNLQRTDIYELEEPFRKGQKGSSAMPHKRNPVGCEQLCGLARVLRGDLLVAFENIALWHERDISHSSAERIIIPDAMGLIHYMLHQINRILDGAQPKPDRIAQNLTKTGGLIYSQKVLLALIERGVAREAAYEIVQRNAMKSWSDQKPLADHLLADPEFAGKMTMKELKELMNPNSYLKYLDEIYGQCDL